MRNENEKSFAGELEFNERLFFRKEQKERDKSGIRPNPYTVYRPTEQNSFSVVIHIYHSIHNKSQYHGEEYFSVR